jgi:hypothetical protein
VTDDDPEQQKEAHRLGTIGKWDAPDAGWAAEYDWTRYRGPPAYPVPGAWVLNIVEADGIIWYRYPDVGEGHATDTDVRDAVEGHDRRRGATAMLGNTIVDEDRRTRETTLEQELTIAGETVFRRVEPDEDDLYATVAAALAAFDDGTDAAEIAVEWASGRLPEDIREAQERERREDENQQLGEFS